MSLYKVVIDGIEEREDAEFLALFAKGVVEENHVAAGKVQVVEVFDQGPHSLGKDQVVEALGSVRKPLDTCQERNYMPAFDWASGLLLQCEDAVKKL